jgi:uncharacterized membrane protein
MFKIEDFFNLAGSLICHQLPSRSLHAGITVLPVCARDTGIYAGIFTSMLFLLLTRRYKSDKPPGTATAVFMCTLMLPMVLDGLLSYTGIISTNNTTRLLTGAFFGLPIPLFLAPAAHFSINGVNEKKVLKKLAELIPVYLFLLVLCGLYLYGLIPYIVAGLIFISAFLFLLTRLSYTVLVRLRRFRTVPLYAATFGATISVLLFLYMLSAFVLQPIKAALLGG